MREEHSGSTAKGEQSELMPARETLTTRNNPARIRASRQRSTNPPVLPDSPYSFELHIKELVLQGLAATESYLIGDAVQRELTRLFAEEGAPATITQGGEIERLDAGEFEVTPGSNSEMTGAQLAKAIYGGFGQ